MPNILFEFCVFIRFDSAACGSFEADLAKLSFVWVVAESLTSWPFSAQALIDLFDNMWVGTMSAMLIRETELTAPLPCDMPMI